MYIKTRRVIKVRRIKKIHIKDRNKEKYKVRLIKEDWRKGQVT